MVALSATDFGNFITHPLMKPPSPPINTTSDTNKLLFLRENVSLDASTGSVVFFGTYAGSKWKFTLRRDSDSGKKAKIDATLVQSSRGNDGEAGIDYDAIQQSLALTTSNFFNEMVFELDGTFLSFEDMMLTPKGREPSVMLSLSILVRKFPSPGIEF